MTPLRAFAMVVSAGVLTLWAAPPVSLSHSSIEPPQSPKSEEDYAPRLIVSAAGDQFRPAVAYSPAVDRFLVAWEDAPTGSLGDVAIRGVLVDVRGAIQGSAFDIAAGPGTRRHNPRLAYNANVDEFLVVYEYDYSASDTDVRARRVQANGTLLGAELGVATTTSKETKPVVSHNTAANNYFVVWEQWVGDVEFGHSDIYAQRLSGAGAFVGGAIAVKAAAFSQVTPATAYFSSLNQYSVMWVDRQSTLYPRIYEQRFESNGVKVGPEYNSTGFGANFKPHMVYNAVQDEYAYVFENKSYGPPVEMRGYVSLFSLAHGWGFSTPISWNFVRDEYEPEVAFNAATRSYAIVWEQAYSSSDHDIYVEIYQMINQNTCCLRLGPSPVSTLGAWEGNPAIASSDGSTSLVVWEDTVNPGKGLDLYGAVISHGKAYLPLVRKGPH